MMSGVGRVVLPVIGLLARPLAALGIDPRQLQVLLGVKLALDDRRLLNPGQATPKKPPTSSFRLTLLVNLLFGIGLAMALVPKVSPLTGLTLLFTALLTFLSLNMVSGYSDSLLDPADHSVLAPRPISHRTALAARIAHVMTFVGLQTAALSMAGFFVGTYKWGWRFAPVFVLSVAGGALFVMAAVLMVYAAVLRVSGRERLRDLVAWVQIIFVVGVTFGYQLGARAIDIERLADLDLHGRPWLFLLPPAWFAGPAEWLLGQGGPTAWILSALALLVPAACVWAVVRYLADAFFLLFESGGDGAAPAPKIRGSAAGATAPVARGGTLSRRLGSWLCRRPGERAGFDLAWTMMSRDRQTKLRLYPTIGMMIAFAILPSLGFFGNDAQRPDSVTQLFMLYLVGVFGATMISQLQVSEQAAAAEAVYAAPLRRPGSYQMGSLKALLVRLLLPSAAILAVVLGLRHGRELAADLALALAASLLIIAFSALLSRNQLPFSKPPVTQTQARIMTRMFVLMFAATVLGGIHALLSKFLPLGVLWAIPVTVLAALICLRAYARTPWSAIESRPS